MNSIDGIEADYDAGKMSVDEACRKLREAGLAALIWTTPSHAPEAPRYRILCPTSKELPVSGRKALIARLNGVLGGVLDGASFTDFAGHELWPSDRERGKPNDYRACLRSVHRQSRRT